MPVGDVTPEVVLILGAAATLLFTLFAPRRLQWAGAALALVTIAAAMGATARLLGDAPALTFFGTWALDGAALWGKQIILVAAAACVGLSPEWFRTDPRHGDYYTVLLLATLGAALMAGAADTMQLVAGVLLSSVTGYVLAAFHRRSPLSVEAGMKFFLIGGFTNALLLYGVVLLFGLTGSTLYEATQAGLAQGADPVALVAATGLVAVGLAFKLGAVPAHAWMPDVAQGAPAPSAAFLTVVPKVAALIAFARLMSVLPPEVVGWRPLAAVLAAATMTLGNLAALWQRDLRRLLGWSAVSQSGYALMAVVAIGRSPLALPALLFFLAAYALANLAAFGVVTELRGRTELDAYAGLARRRPALAAALIVSFLSLVGIPPLAGFTGKLALFGATIAAGYAWLAALAIANTVVSLFYYLRVLGPVYFDTAPDPVPVLGRWASVPTLAAAVGVVVAGLAAEPALAAFSRALLLP
ncbi:MAG: NADH-quinone oxidoreductase subunit N [Actinomycetota bacterium]|nr:NADH-quinone oxidoreductase subunit N [Actinomycetota bacterium]